MKKVKYSIKGHPVRLAILIGLALAVAAGLWGVDQGRAQSLIRMPPGCENGQMRCITNADREAAAARQAAAREAAKANATALRAPSAPLFSAGPGGTPNYFGPDPNYANSPIIPKFVDSLPGLGSANKNTLNNFIPVAVPIANPLYPSDNYYEIGLQEYTQQMHSSLPATTKLRGYLDLSPGADGGNVPRYLGPLIVAHTGTPVRLKFSNLLTPNSTFFIPIDTSYMGAGPVSDGVNSATASENRAVLHLHGGNTPWISDGTPHQWITPAGETVPNALGFAKGFSFQNVPDMVGPGKPIVSPSLTDGQATYYWSNQQSSRLMFFHDHAYGITRLNVYAGEAAGYLLVDSVEEGLINSGALPNQAGVDQTPGLPLTPPVAAGGVYAYGIPLIIQDKTFVDAANIAAQDPTWNWGSTPPTPVTGDLWFPHVYMPNQNPADLEGVNAFGRWDYGPWFWPPLTTLGNMPVQCPPPALLGQMCPATPNPSGVPEAFMDTPLVNGQAYPYVTVGRQAYRFRILSAGNDRMWNLQLYYAVNPTTYTPATFTAAGALATPPAGVCTSGGATGCTEVGMVSAVPHNVTPPPASPNQYQNIPVCSTVTQTSPGGLAIAAIDPGTGRPLNGTGLPAACWPTTWPTDGRDGGVPDPMTAGPAIIQIGTEGGLMPAVATIPSTPVGYEYNRRNIVVLNVANKGLFLGPAERADVVIDFSSVPDGSTLILYNDAPAPVPASDTRNDYYTGNPNQTSTGGAPSTTAGFGPNTRTIMQIRVSGATATPFNLANLQTALPTAYAGSLDKPIVPETAYNAAFPATPAAADTFSRIQDTSLTFTPMDKTTPITQPMLPKAIQELFELDYGKMNSTLGVELPFTNFNTQTTIPFGYIDPVTEQFTNGQTQLWKITHNGVDTHAIHFHLFNVQVINRVGWDGQVRQPDPNELGWKDTVRMNPLEDIVVALKPYRQNLPWWIPNSIRPMDVTRPLGSTAGFSRVDPNNLPITVVNEMSNFGWEYVWHCHLLGHEENDMMRPMVLRNQAAADFNGNWKTDIVWKYEPTGGLYIWYMNSTAISSGGWITPSADPNWEVVGTGDFDGNGSTDLLWRHIPTGGLYIWFMDGGTTTMSSGGWITPSPDPNSEIAGTGDFDGNGSTDFLWRDITTGGLYIWYMNGTAMASSQSIIPSADPDWQVVGTGDFDADGNIDLLWRHLPTGGLYIWFMSGAAMASGQWVIQSADPNWLVVGIGDFDGDGKADFLWKHIPTGGLYVWFMDGATLSSAAWLIHSAAANWTTVAP